jgi:hypothetical protein
VLVNERFSTLTFERSLGLNEQVLKLRSCFLDYCLVVVVLFLNQANLNQKLNLPRNLSSVALEKTHELSRSATVFLSTHEKRAYPVEKGFVVASFFQKFRPLR